MRRYPLLVLFLTMLSFATATLGCDDGDGSPQAANEAPALISPAPASASPMPAATSPTATATVTATAPPRPSATPSPAPAARVDGTVAPQNAGATDPVTVKANPDPLRGTALLRDVRLGVHPEESGWDRIVFEFGDDLPPGAIAYVPSVSACGSGAPVTLRGAAVLAVRFSQAAAHTEAGRPTLPRTTIPASGETILEARQTCDFEGEVGWAIGVKDRQRFKVTLLANPRRVVIDIKQ